MVSITLRFQEGFVDLGTLLVLACKRTSLGDNSDGEKQGWQWVVRVDIYG